MVTDRTSEETENVSKIITGAVKIGVGATILETVSRYIPLPWLRVAAEGSGILLAGSSDDIGNALGNTETKNGGKRQISKSERRLLEDSQSTVITKKWLAKTKLALGNAGRFVKDHPLVAGAVTIAAGADYFVIPKLFENAYDLPTHVASALAFFSTAVAGSVASKVEMVSSAYKTIQMLDKEGKFPGREAHSLTRLQTLAEAWRDNQSNPTRKGLFWGIVTSALVSLLFEAATIPDSSSSLHFLNAVGLHGGPASGFVQAGIGPAESLIAVWGTNGLVDNIDRRIRNFRLRNKLRRAERSITKTTN